jgi:hypothetical protein
VQAAGLVVDVAHDMEVAAVVAADTDDEAEDGKCASFSSGFLVSGSGLSHSAGVLYVQVGQDAQVQWKAADHARSIYPCLLMKYSKCHIKSTLSTMPSKVAKGIESHGMEKNSQEDPS